MTERLTRRWIHAPALQRTHLVLAFPGGAAAEHHADVPAGTSHLFEHVLYRHNELDAHPFDELGGKFGLLTDRAATTAYLAFAPEHAAGAAARIAGWWHAPRWAPEVIDQEREVVADEIRDASRSASHTLRRLLLQELAPSTWLARDHVGRSVDMHHLGVPELKRLVSASAGAGAVLVALGPRRPWDDDLEVPAPAWPPPIAPASPRARIEVRGLPPGEAVIVGGRLLDVGEDADLLAAIAAYAALEYGRIHPAQVAYHTRLRLRFLYPSLDLFGGHALLTTLARCPSAMAEDVGDLIGSMLAEPTAGSSPGRLRRVAEHHLAAALDIPQTRATFAARMALFGRGDADSLLRALPEASLAAPRGGATAVVLGMPR